MAIPGVILVAPDSFKGTFSAPEVAARLGAGLQDAGWAVDACPLADGGEGTAQAMATSLGGEWRETTVSDPLGRPVVARWLLCGEVGVADCAAASGLGLVAAPDRDASAATTHGTGELIAAIVAAGARRVILGAGGSATTDGGAGAVAALRAANGLAGARLSILCDVRTPWERAAEVFSAQKGAGPEEVVALSRRLDGLAGGMARNPRCVPMTGAAGGLTGGLWSEFGAELLAGARHVLEAVGFDRRMRGAAAVVTGEGCLDVQSLAGKVVAEAASRARQAGVPCHAVVGGLELDAFGLRILDLGEVLRAGTARELRAAGGELGRRFTAERSAGR